MEEKTNKPPLTGAYPDALCLKDFLKTQVICGNYYLIFGLLSYLWFILVPDATFILNGMILSGEVQIVQRIHIA